MTMRYLMKGGYWKNSEDEILKAAIMKYGLNQWARIASLMSRKSVKQCKARWYEWLDPSIKKTEWTREEEERLLHLAKLFPAQWRTIAPMLNRTPQMCIEHYEKLLDMTLERQYDEENDPRKLLPGEIDALAEHRPARADPVDMDDDEKEMIAEARVRIANKKGKKEKRKAREKTLEEARRLATIQKFRELRNAGVDFVIERKQKKKVKEFTYGSEIPMERLPVEAGHQVLGQELARANASDGNIANISIAELEGQRREEMEAKRRQQDIDKMKKLRAQNIPGKILKKRVNDPTEIYGRENLELEEPQLKDHEIEELCKLKKRSISQFQRQNRNFEKKNDEETDFKCTDILLADADFDSFDNLVRRIRTPKSSTGIMQQAKDLIQINDPKASLDTSTIMDNKSVSMAPSMAKSRISTPNPLKQFIQEYHKNKDGQSRFKTESEYNLSQINFGGAAKAGPHENKSIMESFYKNQDHLSMNMGGADEKFGKKINTNQSAIGGVSLANFDTTDKHLKAERTAYLKSIFKGLPPPQNLYKIDVNDLDRQYKEATGVVNNEGQTPGNIIDFLMPKLSAKFEENIRNGILERVSHDQTFLQKLNKEDEGLFFNLCDRLKIQAEKSDSTPENEEILNSKIAQINQEVEDRVCEILQNQPENFLEMMAIQILSDCADDIAESELEKVKKE